MPATVYGAALQGMQAIPVAVQADLLRKLPSMTMVGSLSPSVREAEPRVRSAILASGFEFPRCRVVVSLSPADVKKDGTSFDLPVALSVLAATAVVDAAEARRWIFAGELDLEGALRGARGTIAIAWAARSAGFAGIIVPESDCAEAALVSGIEVRSARTLREIALFLNGAEPLPLARPSPFFARHHTLDLKDVVGQQLARTALEVAAAGGHNLLMVGPPGCGKTISLGARATRVRAFGGDIKASKVERLVLRADVVTGACSRCGGMAVFRDVAPGTVAGACVEGAVVRCWWTT